jgi:hypothetical protein
MLFVISCKENSTKPVDDNDNNNNQTGVYFPMKLGYWWKYAVTGQNMPSQITFTAKKDTTINGNKWFIFSDENNVQAQIFRYEGSILMMRLKYLNTVIEYKMFDEKGKIGDSIVTYYTANDIPYMLVSKIIEKGSPMTLRGKTYPDILKLQLDFYTNIFDDGWEFFMTEEDYLAKDVGMIKVFIEGMMDRELLEYSLK